MLKAALDRGRNSGQVMSPEGEYVRAAGIRGLTRTQVVVGAAIFFAFLVILSPLIFISISREGNERDLAEELSRLAAAGHAVTLEEVERRYVYPPEEKNAALVFQRAVERLKIPEEVEETLPPWNGDALPELGEPFPLEWAPLAQRLIDENADAMALFQEGAQMPDARYPGNYRDGFMMLIPHVGGLRGGARFYSFVAVWQVQLEEWNEAAASFEALFAIGESLRNEPTLIAQLTRIAINGIGCLAVERALAARTVSPDFLSRLQAVLEHEARDDFRLKVALEGELAFGNQAFQMVREDPKAIAELDGDVGALADVLGWGYWFTGFLARDHLLYLKIMKEYLDAAVEPLPARLEVALSPEELERRIDDHSPAAVVSSIMIPTISRIMESDALGLARVRIALSIVALERFRIDNGRLPDRLEELSPRYLDEPLIDPISGEAFAYRIEDDWAFVTSAGKIRDEPLEMRLPAER